MSSPILTGARVLRGARRPADGQATAMPSDPVAAVRAATAEVDRLLELLEELAVDADRTQERLDVLTRALGERAPAPPEALAPPTLLRKPDPPAPAELSAVLPEPEPPAPAEPPPTLTLADPPEPAEPPAAVDDPPEPAEPLAAPREPPAPAETSIPLPEPEPASEVLRAEGEPEATADPGRRASARLLVGKMAAAGYTRREASARLRRRYGPDVTQDVLDEVFGAQDR